MVLLLTRISVNKHEYCKPIIPRRLYAKVTIFHEKQNENENFLQKHTIKRKIVKQEYIYGAFFVLL